LVARRLVVESLGLLFAAPEPGGAKDQARTTVEAKRAGECEYERCGW
jgi:hypothetical protein